MPTPVFSRRPAALTCLLMAAMLLLSACGAQTPTATPIPSPTPEAAATETATPEPAATDTPALPTDTATVEGATPTEQPIATPSAGTTPVAELQWQPAGLQGKVVQRLALFSSGANLVMAVGPDGAWHSSYNYTSWESLPVKPGGRQASVSIGSFDVAYISGHTGCASGLPTTLERTTDGGKTWQASDATNKPLVVAAANGGIAYGTVCSGIVKTTDSGATWTDLPASHINNYDPYAIAASPDGQMVYAAYASEGGTGRVNRSTDAGSTWTEVTPKMAAGEEFRAPANLTFVPGSEGRPQDGGLYLTTSQGLWFLPLESNDWKAPKADPNMDKPENAASITALFVDTAYSEEYNKPGPIIYEARAMSVGGAMENVGVFRSTNGGLTWDAVGKGLGKPTVNSLALAPHDPSAAPNMVETLIAATDDGIWTLPLPPPFR